MMGVKCMHIDPESTHCSWGVSTAFNKSHDLRQTAC
jgi:hypothetical protein